MKTWLEIYEETVAELYAYVSRRAGGARELAEDVVQEAYLRAIGRFGGAGAPRNPVAWLKTVAHNLLASHFRRRHAEAVDPAALDRLLAADEVADPAGARLLHAGLARLRTAHAVVLEAFYLDGKDVRAIAAELGVSERAVEGRLRRGREALRERLAKGAVL